jgi:hypothetical protein
VYRDAPPLSFRRTLALLAVLAGTVCGAVVYVMHVRAEPEPVFACLEGTDGVTDVTAQMPGPDGKLGNFDLDADAIDALWAIEGESIWAQDGSYGWVLPADFASIRYERYWIRGYKDGVEFWAVFRVSDDYSIGLVYKNTEPYADANGEHAGYHPCGGWEVAQADIIAALQ